MNRQTLLDILPPSYGLEKVIVKDQDVRDIVKEVLDAHDEFAPDYDLICEQFEGGNVLKRLFDFCKMNLRNDTEGEDLQTTRSPTVLLEKGHCDCKGYAGFIAGILDALNRARLSKWNWCYRFAEYKRDGKNNYHVFIVVQDSDGGEVWIDPVLPYFDCRCPVPDKYFDKKKSAMTLVRMSGIGYQRGGGQLTGGPGGIHALSGYARIGAASSFYNSSGGQVFAVDDGIRPNGMTPDQMGLPFAMEVLNRGYEQRHPGTAAAWWANPPVTFWLNGSPYPLPPPNTTPGGQVPLMPMGLTALYAPSFMGFTIPAGFIRPIVVQGSTAGYQNKLRLSSTSMPFLPAAPTSFPGNLIDPTTIYLSSADSLPLILLEAAVGPLINSFSAFPYANNFNSTNNLDDKMFHHRNADDLLQPSVSKTVLQSVAPIAEIAAQALNFIVPGAGAAAALAIAAGAGRSLAVGPAVVNPATEPGAGVNAAGLPAVAQNVVSWVQANPLLAALIAAVVGIGLYEIIE